MPAPDPLDALSKSIANLSSGQYTPTTSGTTASSGLSPDQQVWHVYLGDQTKMAKDNSLGRFFEPGGKVEKTLPNVVTTDIAMGQFYGWSDAKRKKWGETLQAAGVIAPGDFSWDSLEGWWQKAVTAAGNIKTLGGQNITPEQWVQTRASGAAIGGKDPNTPKTTTFTQKTIPYQDPAALRELIRSSLADKLGRGPDDSEMDDMMDIARSYESSHPSVTKQTTTTDTKGNTSQTSRVVRPGASQAGYQESIDNAAMQSVDYGSYQAAGPLFNALLTAIQAPVDV